MVFKDVYWCEICIDNGNVEVEDFETNEELFTHYKTKHTVDQLIECIDNMGNNPHKFDPDNPEASPTRVMLWMPKPVGYIKELGESIGDQIYEKLMRDNKIIELTYPDFILTMDFMYAQIFGRVYKETYEQNITPQQKFPLDKKEQTSTEEKDHLGHLATCFRSAPIMRTAENKLICLQCKQEIKEEQWQYITLQVRNGQFVIMRQ